MTQIPPFPTGELLRQLAMAFLQLIMAAVTAWIAVQIHTQHPGQGVLACLYSPYHESRDVVLWCLISLLCLGVCISHAKRALRLWSARRRFL